MRQAQHLAPDLAVRTGLQGIGVRGWGLANPESRIPNPDIRRWIGLQSTPMIRILITGGTFDKQYDEMFS